MARPEKNDPRRDKSSAAPAQTKETPVSPAAPVVAGSFFFRQMRWLSSRTVRHAVAMCKHVQKLLNHQRDILAPKAIEELETVTRNLRVAAGSTIDAAGLKAQMGELEKTANKWLKPYPNSTLRENTEVLLVALAVAMGIRTFFLQPFKIPTGSMQPTLYGVTSTNLPPDFQIPTGLQRVKEWFQGTSYIHITAPGDGVFEGADEPVRFAIFNVKQTYYFAGKSMTIWAPPDYGSLLLTPTRDGTKRDIPSRAQVHPGQFFRKGQDIIKLKINAGDHLFVDRLTYNFKAPERGEIIVFETHGITGLPPEQQDTFYIKRLVGLGGETLQIQKDYEVVGVPGRPLSIPVGHLVIDGKPLSASDSRFENLYSFYGAVPGRTVLEYVENRYYGHAMLELLGPGVGSEPARDFEVGPDRFFVMGDNTMNSSDSRYWGDFSQQRVIGKSFFVYWPITERFGWSSSRH
jgi:signal peptidase I